MRDQFILLRKGVSPVPSDFLRRNDDQEKESLIKKLCALCSGLKSMASPDLFAAQGTDTDLRLWYSQPAEKWEDAMPIGNGRLGAMVFGRAVSEHLQLNESTLVSGYPGYRDLPLDVRQDFATVTDLIAARKFAEADDYITRHWLGKSWACYQPLGDLYLDFNHAAPIEDYRRELDLARAVVRIQYRCGGVSFSREIFASYPDNVIVIRLTADQPGALNFRAQLGSVHPVQVTEDLTMHGQIPGFVLRRTFDWVEEKGDQWKYPTLWDAKGRRRPDGARVIYDGRGLSFCAQLNIQQPHPDEAVLIFAAASSYGGIDPTQKVMTILQAAGQRSFAELFATHTRDYRSLFDRVTLDLRGGCDLPTDQRLKKPDSGLAALYFQFGRYLLIAGSRPGGQPLNLQGIWNAEVIPPWACQYTLNINTEMNYWPVEICNLSECGEPLWRMIRELAVDGARVAREMYHCRGWVAHHNTTLWRDAQPVDFAAVCSYWPMSGAWLCLHLVDHYDFTGDREFLGTETYPLLKGSCEFYLDWMVLDAKGQLVTPVSTSPENTFVYSDEHGTKQRASVCTGTAMDMAIIHELFTQALRLAETLETEAEFCATLQAALAKLRPYQLGSKGQLLEWQEEFEEEDPQHRHCSHLFGLHPGTQIVPRRTPQLAAAAERSLELRGDGGTGWSKAWKINLWARLGDGDHAHQMLAELLAESTLPSLLDVCPPFQIDGNFGGTAGIAEMLLQSHAGEIELLPALPPAWPNGKVTGLRARGGFEVSIDWKNGKLVAATIQSITGRTAKVRCGERVTVIHLLPGESRVIAGE